MNPSLIILQDLTRTFLSVDRDMTNNFDVNVNQANRFCHFHQSSRHSLGVYCNQIVAGICQANPVYQGGVQGEHQGFSSLRLDLTVKRRNYLKDAVTQGWSDSTSQTGVEDDIRVGEGVLLQTLSQTLSLVSLTIKT